MKKYFFFMIFTSSIVLCADEEHVHNEISPLDANSPELIATFNAIQKIRLLAESSLKEAEGVNELRPLIDLSLGYKHWPNPNPTWYQTAQGLYLTVGVFPHSLRTPWGEVKVFDAVSCEKEETPEKVFNAFRALLKLSFVKNFGEDEEKVTIRFFKNHFKHEISKEELDQYRKSDTHISATKGNLSVYKVTAIDNKPLPETVSFCRKQYRTREIVKKNWQEMLNKISEE
jgi:hypothetical protein